MAKKTFKDYEDAPKHTPAALRTDPYLFETLHEVLDSYDHIKFWKEGHTMRVEFGEKMDSPGKGMTVRRVVRPERKSN